MIEEFKKRALASGIAEQYTKLEDLFETEILNNASSFGEGYQKASNVLKKIEDAVVKIIEDGNIDKVTSI